MGTDFFAVAVQGAQQFRDVTLTERDGRMTKHDSYVVVQVFPDGTFGRYLERLPYDGSWTWLAPFMSYATPLTKADADRLTSVHQGETFTASVIPDVLRRAPETVTEAEKDAAV